MRPPQCTTERGRLAEVIAAAFLQLSGYKVVSRNVRVGSLEIDMIARKGDLVLIAEVRLRRRGPAAAQGWISPEKWRRLHQAARRIADRMPGDDRRRIRIDLLLVSQASFALEVRHIAGCPRRRPAD